jgi:uncharacterized protein YqfA (UPF0365 family)
VLENPDSISKAVLSRASTPAPRSRSCRSTSPTWTSARTSARLQADQAEADKKRFQAEAEKRRAMAVAQEQEYQAEVQKNRALVVLAEAEVPKAMAEAFRSGNLGIMDYYRMKNIEADTDMRCHHRHPLGRPPAERRLQAQGTRDGQRACSHG